MLSRRRHLSQSFDFLSGSASLGRHDDDRC
jgi:hypothetical protein